MRVRFWGTRGLLPAPGESHRRYGGATVCLEVVSAAGARIILDLGTGCIPLGHAMMQEASGGGPRKAAVILSSTRLDHIHGLPFFGPALFPGWELSILGPSQAGRELGRALDGALNPNYSPLYGVENLAPQLALRTLTDGEISWGGFRITTRELPDGRTRSLGVRIEADGGRIACMTDVEYDGALSDAALELASDVDVLVHDAMEPAELVVKRRDGALRAPKDAVELAREAGARRLFLYHHDPDRDDARMDALLEELRRSEPSLDLRAAREGEQVEVSPAT